MEQQYYVEMRDINKQFGDFQALEQINFGIEKGKLIGLLGPSGSGKTTILRILAGLETAETGDIIINGQVVNDIPASQRGIGFVFQNYALFRYMTVFENVAFGLRVQKWPKSRVKERVNEMLRLVGLEGLEKRYPSQLSGGQRQRVAFARALAPEPQLLLLDEPFAAIDAKVRQELRRWLKGMISTVGITSIFVTHDQEEAIEVADEIIITNQGRIEQIGKPVDIYRNPTTPFVARFIGDSAELENVHLFPGFEYAADQIKHAIIRPEYLTVYKKGEPVEYPNSVEPGVVVQSAFRGTVTEYQIRLSDGTILTANRLVDTAPLAEGEQVQIFARRLLAFDEERAFPVENICLAGVRPYVI